MEVPQVQVQERIIHKPVTIIQEREVQVPKIEYVERIVEVPHVQQRPVEQIVQIEVPQIQTQVVYKDVEVPWARIFPLCASISNSEFCKNEIYLSAIHYLIFFGGSQLPKY